MLEKHKIQSSSSEEKKKNYPEKNDEVKERRGDENHFSSHFGIFAFSSSI